MSVTLDGTDITTVGARTSRRDGWKDSPQVRKSFRNIPGTPAWEAMGGDPMASPRVVRFRGSVIGADHDDLILNIDALNALVATGVLVEVECADRPLVVANGYGTIRYTEISPVLATSVARFEMTFTCPDPRRYDIGGGRPGTPL